MTLSPEIIAFGLGVGILVGMTGVGGGSLMTPILILIIGVKPVTAIGTDVAYSAVTRSVGAWRHWRQRTVDIPLSLWMAAGSVPAAVIGVVALKALQHSEKKSFDDTVLITLGAVLLLCGIATLGRLLLPQTVARERERSELTVGKRIVAVVLGVAIGFVIGVTSAGSGALITVALILIFRLAPRQVVATDMFNAAILLWAATLAHIVAGDVDYGLMGTILIGSVPGVWIGSALAYRVPIGSLRIALAALLIGASLALGQKGGLNIPTAVIAAFPFGVGLMFLIWWHHARNKRSPASGEIVAGEAVAGEALSREAVSREAVSREAVSREAVSREAVSREATSGDATPVRAELQTVRSE